jgi:hypothetical protein
MISVRAMSDPRRTGVFLGGPTAIGVHDAFSFFLEVYGHELRAKPPRRKEAEELKARSAKDQRAFELAWREAARQWERADRAFTFLACAAGIAAGAWYVRAADGGKASKTTPPVTAKLGYMPPVYIRYTPEPWLAE